MAVQLVVQDGTPWWESPDIWAVPGADPNAPPGMPVAGSVAYLWTRVANNGDEDADGVTVDFWVANPAQQIRKSTSLHVGTAFADVVAGGSQEVLCLVPWHVALINGGHECVVVEASHMSDPLSPSPTDPDVLDALTYPQIAQHNLSVVVISQFHLDTVLSVAAGLREARVVTVAVSAGGEVSSAALARLGLGQAKPGEPLSVRVGLSEHSQCGRGEFHDIGKIVLEVDKGTSRAVHLGLRAHPEHSLQHNEYVVVRVTESIRERIVGGTSFVVIGEQSQEDGNQ